MRGQLGGGERQDIADDLAKVLLAQAEFDVDAAGLCPGAQCVASAGSVGVRSRWHRFELGAAIRTGLSTEGRNFWGKPGVVATLGFHLSDLGFLP